MADEITKTNGRESMQNEIEINGEKYVRKSSMVTGERAVVVVDRGWIYAGDVEEKDGRIILHNAVWIFRWESCGFAAVLEDPSKADIRPVPYPVDIPAQAEIYRIPVPSGWGLP